MPCENCGAKDSEKKTDELITRAAEIYVDYCGRCGATWGHVAKPVNQKNQNKKIPAKS